MPLSYVPTFVLIRDGENQPLQEELSGSLSVHVAVPSPTTVRFLVREKDQFAGHDVDIVRHSSQWSLNHVSTRNEWRMESDDGRTWIPEPEVGRSVGALLEGASKGQVTGGTAASMMFDLLLHLEVELSGDEPWLGEYFPKFFAHYSKKLERAKVGKVEDVMES